MEWHNSGRSSGFAAKAATMQNYNVELLHRIEELREKRDEVKRLVQLEEEEKANIQKDLAMLTKRLSEIDDGLSRRYSYANDYDKTINEVESAYAKFCR
ncbi:hypothetical protein O6H91_11G103100 [Diphasiastrum complanatum]|uniref:Uncharacterized protein n=1 Tax=Diphasiastrum complanatum TaxID=34168 RepID=A0ACC2CD92_DIPCM|nr:hypothetical protein O6H91_11G103100 [Diphasiastrum complanatum]